MSTTRTDHDPDATGQSCDAFGAVPKTTVTVFDRAMGRECALYTSVEDDLTESEARKLAYAQQHQSR